MTVLSATVTNNFSICMLPDTGPGDPDLLPLSVYPLVPMQGCGVPQTGLKRLSLYLVVSLSH